MALLLNRKRRLRRILLFLLTLFIGLNLIAYLHAYRFTHFSSSQVERTSESPGFFQKLKILFTGISNPRPINAVLPTVPYETVIIKSNKELHCWLLKKDTSTRTIILFHGYGGEKSSMLDKAYVFLNLGFNVLLVDFMGSGKSGGNSTTIGFDEAMEVRDCFNWVKNTGCPQVYLFGTSMGAVAIMKAISDYGIQPTSIILECPFGTMYKTVKARFKLQGAPTFPMAPLLMFWGGVQNGFWAFGHNPEEYAKQISCPSLLLYGDEDPKVSREEIDQIFANLKGAKHLATYPVTGHENYLIKNQKAWTDDVSNFLKL